MMTIEEMKRKLTCEELAGIERCVAEYEAELLLSLMRELLDGSSHGCWKRRYNMETELKKNVWTDNDK